MTQNQFEQELALQTGESRRMIRHRGFQLVVLRPPRIVNWDRREMNRVALFPDRQNRLTS